jgi:hypothetical protein
VQLHCKAASKLLLMHCRHQTLPSLLLLLLLPGLTMRLVQQQRLLLILL